MNRLTLSARLIDLVARLRNETITSDEHRELQNLLRDDAEAQEIYFELIDLDAGLRDWAERKDLDDAVEVSDVTADAKLWPNAPRSVERVPDCGAFGHQGNPTQSGWHRKTAALAIAASLLIAAGWLASQRFPKPMANQISASRSSVSLSAAIIGQSVGGYDRQGNAFQIGSEIPSGSFEVDRGIVLLKYQNGAEIAIEGPASLNIINTMHLRLQRGVITVNIPESAVGFVVDTGSAHVVDLGTSFGVSVGKDADTEVCVFEGEVEVNHRKDVDTMPRSVIEGQSVRASQTSISVEDVEYRTAVFERAWPVSSGVLQTTGSMKFVSPGPAFVPGRYKDDKQILVFAEKQDVMLTAPLQVDLREPGEYKQLPEGENPILPAGQKVRSYLIQLDSVQTNPIGPDGLADTQRVVSQITFDSPIIGLIVTAKHRANTDAMFGHPDGQYGGRIHAGGIEPRVASEGSGLDTVILAAGRRTLSLDLTVRWDIDQIRVLVGESK